MIIHCDVIEENAEPHFACLRHARFIIHVIVQQNSPVSQQFSPRGEQPEHHILAHKLQQPTAWCIAILLLYKTRRYYKKFDSTKSLGVYYLQYVSKYHYKGYRAWIITYYVFTLKKQIAPLTKCYNPLLVHNKPIRAPAVVKLVYSIKNIPKCFQLCSSTSYD